MAILESKTLKFLLKNDKTTRNILNWVIVGTGEPKTGDHQKYQFIVLT